MQRKRKCENIVEIGQKAGSLFPDGFPHFRLEKKLKFC